MTHFGIFCPGAIGHLNPMCILGRELLRRGHNVTLFGVADVEAKVARSGLAFYQVGKTDFPLGYLSAVFDQLGAMSGLEGVKFAIEFFKKETLMWLRDAPGAIEKTGVDALIVDQVTASVGTVADHLKLPFVTVCNALPINREPDVPPYFTSWQYQQTWWAKLRNQLGNALFQQLTRSAWAVIVQQRQQWQLPPYQQRDDAYSKLAQICQVPAVLDFPRQSIPKWWHYTGPLQDPSDVEPVTCEIPFPFNQLTDKPLIYASLGTLQNCKTEIFECIAAACTDLEAQLVISLGNPNRNVADFNFPGSPIVVAYAPHQKLINRASLVVTHAGLNTVLGTLSRGIPLVAIPITNEQPGIAARLARTGAGKVVPLKQLNESNLRQAISQVLTEPGYRDNAARIQAAIQASGGVEQAANIIEQAIQTREPVVSQ